MSAQQRASLDDARRMLALLARPGDVYELRALARINGQQHTTSGYFDNLDELVRTAVEQSGKHTGIYITINPVDPALLARAPKNRIRRAGSGDTTGDRDVRRRRNLLIDVDPVRPAGISSTDAEHQAAIALARTIRDDLTALGWPVPILADSGNGGHLIYSVDLPVDDSGLIRRVLAKLSKTYTTATLKIDEKVFNPSRISKIYGTLTCKGEDTIDRPHRLSKLIEEPACLVEIGQALLEAYAPPESSGLKTVRDKVDRFSREHGRQFDLDAWIATHLPDAKERPWDSGRRWILPVCPFNDQHDRGEAYVTQGHDGKISAGCQHESCFKDWKSLRSRFEPDAYERRNGDGERRLTDREPPPEVIYQSEDYVEHPDDKAAADRDSEPAAPRRRWWWAPELVDEIWKRKDDPWISLRLGSADDGELCRIRAGGIAAVIGGSGSGKSSLVSNLLIDHARNVGPAIALSIELPADELAARIVGIRCDATWEQALRGEVRHEFMVDALALPRLCVLEREDATLANLKAAIAEARRLYPEQPILCAVDYAQIMETTEREERQRVASVFKQIDRTTRNERVVTIAVNQMGRGNAKAARDGERIGADAADLGAESAAIERYATVTLTIGLKKAREDGSELVELSIGKWRMGGGDRVVPMSYYGRSGLWRVAGEAKAAAEVRAARDTEAATRKAQEIRNLLVGAAQRAAAPVSREQLQQLIHKGNTKEKKAAIEELLAAGELVEVARKAPRSKSWTVWTRDRVNATPDLRLVSDLNEGDRYG